MKKGIVFIMMCGLLLLGCGEKKNEEKTIEKPNTTENFGQMVKPMPINLGYFKSCIAQDDIDDKQKEYKCINNKVEVEATTSNDEKVVFDLELSAALGNEQELVDELNKILKDSNLIEITLDDINNLQVGGYHKINELDYKKDIDDNKIELEIRLLG